MPPACHACGSQPFFAHAVVKPKSSTFITLLTSSFSFFSFMLWSVVLTLASFAPLFINLLELFCLQLVGTQEPMELYGFDIDWMNVPASLGEDAFNMGPPGAEVTADAQRKVNRRVSVTFRCVLVWLHAIAALGIPVAECVDALKGPALPRVRHSGKIAFGLTLPALHACGSTSPFCARCC
jgi:hypothetical protein